MQTRHWTIHVLALQFQIRNGTVHTTVQHTGYGTVCATGSLKFSQGHELQHMALLLNHLQYYQTDGMHYCDGL